MRRLLILFLCIVLFSSGYSEANAEDQQSSLLWRISGPGITKPSYLFGTIHMICPDDYLWTAAMKKSLAACNKVCFELDMDDPALLEEASAGFIDTSGKMLREYFTEAQYARLRQFMHDSLDADISGMQMMKPVVLQTLLLAKAMACSFPVSYEANIMVEARKAGKEIVGLESVREQLDLFDDIPDDSAALMVMNLADSFAESKRDYSEMLTSYKAQDLPALYRQVMASGELSENLGAFLDERNKKWIPRIRSRMMAGSVFFAVGAAHLYGDTGVINLLRKEGYTLSPVR